MARGGVTRPRRRRHAGGVMPVDIVEARDARLREAVFRFRYDIYVREMARVQKDADHTAGRIEDRLDAFGMVLAAVDRGTGLVIGTVRANVLGDGDIGPYGALYGLTRLSPDERRVSSITTRLMVERTKRGSAVGVRLAMALFRYGLSRGVETDYIDCNTHLVSFFEHLGYQPLRLIEHSEYGRVTVMRLALRDAAHLRRVGSPLAAGRDDGRQVGEPDWNRTLVLEPPTEAGRVAGRV
jgi:GNAT superfamily N-acetyltransferase